MGIRKRSGRAKPFIATVDLGLDRDGNRQRYSRGFERRGEAVNWERREYERAGRRRRVSTQLPSVGAWLLEWLDRGEQLHEFSPRHIAESRRLIDRVLVPLHPLRLDELTVAELEAWLATARRRGASPHSLRRARNVVSAALNEAIRRELIDRNPAEHLRISLPPRKPPTVLSSERPDNEPSEVERFLAAIDSHRLAPFWLTCMTLALRPSEALGLRWSDVDLERRRVSVGRTQQYSEGAYHERDRTKTGQGRVIPLPDVTARALESRRLAQLWEQGEARTWESSDRVFTNQRGGPLHAPYALRQLKKTLAEAGLPQLTLYGLRHTGATWLISIGVPVEQIREIMGHSTIQMTLAYAQISDALRRDAMSRLDGYLESATRADGGKTGGKT